jgi:hypothetical protein
MVVLGNGTLHVRLDETTLNLAVTDLRAGKIWETPGASFALQVYDIGNQVFRWYTTAGFDETKVKYGDNPQSACWISLIEQSADHVKAEVVFTGLELGFVVELALHGAELTVTIPNDGWVYTGEKGSEIICLDCYPLFGGQPHGADGCMVMPHFGGAIRTFAEDPARQDRMAAALAADPGSAYAYEIGESKPDPTASQIYAAMAYGQQSAWRDLIAYPLWGIITGDSGWAAYVPLGAGDADAAVVTAANRGPQRLCGVWGRFHLREHAHDRRVDEDRQLVITFLHEPGLHYATVGRVYREYLVQRAHIPTLRVKAAQSPQTAYLTQAYYMRPMLALKRYYYINNPNPDGKGILDVYMTCDDLADELARWKHSGVDKLYVQIVGANSEGHDGNYPTYFPLEPKVGGEEGFVRLLERIRALEYRSSVHVNIRSYNRPAPDFRIETVIRDRDGGLFYEGSGPGGDDYGACPAVARHEFTQMAFPRLKQLGLSGGMYTDFMLGVLFRCYHPLHPLTRRGYLNEVKAYLNTCVTTFGATRMESIIAPILDTVDCVARAHALEVSDHLLRGAEITARGLVDATVPLQVVIYHGLVMHGVDNSCLFNPDPWAHTLRLVSIAAKPIEELRGPQPQWDAFHTLQYRVLCEQLHWLQFEWLDDYQTEGDLSCTQFGDGTVIYVNHGAEPVMAKGRSLPGRSFWVIPGDAAHQELFMTEDESITRCEPAIAPDGSRWPDGRPREGVEMTVGAGTDSLGIMIGKDFA